MAARQSSWILTLKVCYHFFSESTEGIFQKHDLKIPSGRHSIQEGYRSINCVEKHNLSQNYQKSDDGVHQDPSKISSYFMSFKTESLNLLLKNHSARKAETNMEAFCGDVDSNFSSLSPLGLGGTTIGTRSQSFTWEYIENSHFQILLKNHLFNLNQILYKVSLGKGEFKLLKGRSWLSSKGR